MSVTSPAPGAVPVNSDRRLTGFWWYRHLQLALVVLLSVLPYLPCLGFGFVYDDDAQILQNPLLHSWRSLPSFFTHQSWSFLYPATIANYYRPMFLIWLSLNRHLFGLQPAGWHVASICLHAAIAGLLFLLFQRHGFPPWIAFTSALYFGLHSAHIESVAWISGSTDLLACLGMLVSLLLWWRSIESRSLPLLFASLLAYCFALLSKETSIVFPFIIFTYAWLFPPIPCTGTDAKGHSFADALRKTVPVALTAAFFLVLRSFVLGAPHGSGFTIPVGSSIASAPLLLLFYFRHLLWPAPLSLFYDLYPVQSFGWSSFWFPLIIIASLFVLFICFAYRWHDRSTPAACAWLLFPLAPVLLFSLFPANDMAHDRYLYIPSIGAALFLAIALRVLVSFGQLTLRHLLLPLSAVLALLASSTLLQLHPWKDDFSLYKHACSLAPNNSIACNNLAVAFIGHGEYSLARSVLVPVLRRDPNFALGNANMGTASYHLGDFPAAEQYLRRAISLNPASPRQYLDLGMICYRTGRLPEAVQLLRRAIAIDPAGEGYHVALGTALMSQNDYREACDEFRAELRLHPNLLAAKTLLSLCEQGLAQSNGARAHQ
jgi:tetratricopeptide (TPR) repeat protein